MTPEQQQANAIIDQALEVELAGAFRRQDWQRSVKHVARAQAILWFEATTAQRKAALAKAEASMNRSGE